MRVFDFEDKNAERGQMILLLAFEASDKDNEKIIKIIADELARQFFNAPTDNIEFAFENALAKANITVKDILLTKPKNWLNKIHIACLVMCNQEVHLTSVGDMHAYLVHHDKIVDVFLPAGGPGAGAGRIQPPRTPNPVKLFSNITSGRLLPQAALVLINEPVLDYLSTERIRKLSQEFEPTEAINKLHELLSAAPTNKQFGLVIVKRLPVEDRIKPPLPLAKPATEPELERAVDLSYLKPAEPANLKIDQRSYQTIVRDYLLQGGQYLAAFGSQYGQKALNLALVGLSKTLEKIQYHLTRLLPRLLVLSPLIKTMITDQRARAFYLSKFKDYYRHRQNRAADYFKNLAPNKKRVLLATAALGLLLIISVIIRLESKSRSVASANYQNLVSSINEKSDQAEATLIYKDETRAREILRSALGELKNLPQTNSAERGQYEYLAKRLAALSDRLAKKKNLGDLTPVAAIAPAPANPAQSGLALAGTGLFYYDGQSVKLVKINSADGQFSDVPLGNGAKTFNQAIALDAKSLALFGVGSVMFVNAAQNTTRLDALNTDGLANEPLTSYAKNVYTFSRSGSRIIRYREAGGALQASAPWLKENYDMSQMLDIAVDGSVYTLARGGDIHLFLNNAPSLVFRSALTEPVETGARLYTNENLKSLYILDPAHQRVIQLTKRGELQNQYVSPQLKTAVSLVVTPDEKQIYILAGDKVFRLLL